MLHRIRANTGRRACITAAVASLALTLVGVSLFTGFAADAGTSLANRLFAGNIRGAAPSYDGPASLEERIVAADVIARVRLLYMSPSIEELKYEWRDDNGAWTDETFYDNALAFHFEVLEYLKGSGSSEVIGVVKGIGIEGFNTRLAAQTMGEDLSEAHDDRWDSNEAIVFLSKKMGIINIVEQPDRYLLGSMGGPGYGPFYDYYSIDSPHSKRWLPAADIDGAKDIGKSISQGSIRDDRHGEQRFLTGAEPEDLLEALQGNSLNYAVANSGYNAALGARGDSSTMTFSYLKDLIDELETEIAAGDGSEEYHECIYHKYEWIRHVRYTIATYGSYRPETHHFDIASGLPTGTVFADGRFPFDPPEDYDPLNHQYLNPVEGDGWIEGGDAALFDVLNDISIIANARPLPAGEYSFYYNDRWDIYIICNAYPDELRKDDELVVRVTAPAGALHEAFFDPVTLGDAVGADGDSGVLKSTSFETEEGETVMDRISWNDGQARMEFSPHSALPDHHIDFIALDGSVSLRLDFNHAVERVDDDGAATLAWGVCEQPWVDGDLLMLRISEGTPDDGVAAVNDEECLAALPEHIPAPEPTATPEP